MQIFIQLVKRYKKEVILSPLFKLLEAVFELFVPLLVAYAIDYGMKQSNQSVVSGICGMIIILGAVGLLCAITAQYFAAKASVKIAGNLRMQVFHKTQILSYQQLDRFGKDYLITLLNYDIDQIQNGINLTLRLVLRSPLIVFGAGIMAFWVDVRGGIIFAIIIPCITLVMMMITKFAMPVVLKIQKSMEELFKIVNENLVGLKILRAYGVEKREDIDFNKYSEQMKNNQMRHGTIVAFTAPLCSILINLGIVGILLISKQRVAVGVMQIGAVIALINYMSQILVEMVKLSTLISSVSKMFASYKRVNEFIETANSEKKYVENHEGNTKQSSKLPTAIGQVTFRNVTMHYYNCHEPAIDKLSYVFAKKVYGVIGSSGAGKTTAMLMLRGLYQANQGDILLGDLPIHEYSSDELQKYVAMISQKPVIIEASIRDNLLWGNRKHSDEELMNLLEKLEMRTFVDKLECGLDTMLYVNGNNLSGGQKQRISIARVLLRDAQILIVDDALSALDAITEQSIIDLIKEQYKDKIVLLVSQKIVSLKHSDEILVLEDGRLVSSGPHSVLMKTCSVYQELYQSQFGTCSEQEVG